MTPSKMPLFQIEALEYLGAFRLPAETYLDSTANYSEGPIEFASSTNSVFVVGHTHDQAIAEFQVPSLVKSNKIHELETASHPLQPYSKILHRVRGGNPEQLDRIGGLELLPASTGVELLVNAYEYYDAPGDNRLSTFVVRSASDLDRSRVDGFYRYTARAGASSGWISRVPRAWQTWLGGDLITGHASGIPIVSRASLGPSAFVFDSSTLLGNAGDAGSRRVPVQRMLEFTLEHPLHEDLLNETRRNRTWTFLSHAVFGMIVPGTRTYLTIGHSGGHRGGVCYKCTSTSGESCGGYCARESDDYDHYYWLWDLADLYDVLRQRRRASSVRPYDHGVLPTPFKTRRLGGGTFDASLGRLFVTILDADQEGAFRNTPIVAVFDMSLRDVLRGQRPVHSRN